MSKNIVFEGWLTKSPPTKRIWRTRWRRRWFALRQSGELPGQYILDYYADRNCRRLKGSINLDLCEQVDAGLHMERTGNGTLDPKLRGSVFTIQTQQRTYHLEADCEADMENWVDAICRVCGLRSTDEPPNALDVYQNNTRALSEQNESADATGPYIPISECITGVRAQQGTQTFKFNPKNRGTPLGQVSNNKNRQIYKSQPHIRTPHTELSENDSNLSEEDCKSLTASQSNIRDFSVTKSFTKLQIDPNIKIEPPEPPPRPPKTLSKDFVPYQGPKFQEPLDVHDNTANLRSKRSPLAPASPARPIITPARVTDDEDDCVVSQQSLQYCNLSTYPLTTPPVPPAVDRALKPRHPSVGNINQVMTQDYTEVVFGPVDSGSTSHPTSDSVASAQVEESVPKSSTSPADEGDYVEVELPQVGSEPKITKSQSSEIAGLNLSVAEAMRHKLLHYMDLDLPCTDGSRRNKDGTIYGRSQYANEPESDYKIVDFVKTEAFNSTRQDAEALRLEQH